MRGSRGSIAWVVFAVVVGVVCWVMAGARADGQERAEAELRRIERLDAAAQTQILVDSLEAEKERTRIVMETLEETRRRADEEASQAEVRIASLTAEAELSGAQAVREIRVALACDGGACPVDLEGVAVAFEQHLEDDVRERAAFRERIEIEVDARIASEGLAGVWENRALLAERALDASRMECQLCAEEAEQWREIASPGWFTRFRQNLPGKLLTVAATLLVVAAL